MPASIPNDIYQYSLSTAYTSGLTDGGPPVAFLTNHGTYGIGIFESDSPSSKPNDMIQIDSVTYSISPTGHIVPAEKDDTMPFVMVTVFQPTSRIKLPPSTTREVLQEKLRRNTPLPFCIRGKFRYLNTQQETYWDVEGVVFGFVVPEWQRGVSGEGVQSRFLSEDRRRGGRVLDFEVGEGVVLEWARCGRLHLGFPQDEEFDELKM